MQQEGAQYTLLLVAQFFLTPCQVFTRPSLAKPKVRLRVPVIVSGPPHQIG
jgi:hypothetical protein